MGPIETLRTFDYDNGVFVKNREGRPMYKVDILNVIMTCESTVGKCIK